MPTCATPRGLLQLVFDEDTPKEVFTKAETLKSEYVVICRGKLRERAAKTDKIATGDVELYVSELRVLSEAQTPPFEIRDGINVNDDLRLRYRYLDLRRPSMHEPIVLRSKIMQIIRSYFCDNHFTEIETPTLIKSTPEGARDYLVPSRVQPGHFYALPQSPQLYKQILMLSGFDRYFQIARCYRDEDLRADRQPEFTQVDEEMSFVTQDDVITMNEGLLKRLWKEVLGIDLVTPFVRMPWNEAMSRFGSDKPDTRFGLEIQDVTEVFAHTEFKPFAAVVEAGGSIRAINARGLADKLTRKNIDKLGEVARTYGAKGLAYSRLTAEGTSSSFEKFLTEAEKAALYAALGAETGDVLLLVSDASWVKACTALGQVRLDIARKHGLIDPRQVQLPVGGGLPAVRVQRAGRPLDGHAPPLHAAQGRGSGQDRKRPRRLPCRGLRHRAQRRGTGRRFHAYQRPGTAGPHVPRPGFYRGEGPRQLRLPDGRLQVRRAAAWRHGLRPGPPGDADAGTGFHPRRDRLPQGAECRRAHERRAPTWWTKSSWRIFPSR